MTEQFGTRFPQFFLTVPAPCPYLPNRLERKVFTQLQGGLSVPLNDALTHAGFRRSQNIAYKPACEGCNACQSVRVVSDSFEWTPSFKRIKRMNKDITATVIPCVATDEQFGILRSYLDQRHAGGGMSDMTALDYASMVEDTTIKTHVVEYRAGDIEDPYAGHPDGRLVGVALTDVLGDGLSMVYSFFDPDYDKRSLGNYMVLDHIERSLEEHYSYVYLGYWVPGSPKMDYKARFRPLEMLSGDGWVPLKLPDIDL